MKIGDNPLSYDPKDQNLFSFFLFYVFKEAGGE